VRVVVNFDLCELNALCTIEAPEVFAVVERDGVEELEVVMADVPDELAGRAAAAAEACPTQAIALEGQ
jgi:ferredoxin